jgi:hypothetical protein
MIDDRKVGDVNLCQHILLQSQLVN